MIPLRPPRRDCLLVAPERQRQELGWLGQALEAFDREEAVDAGKIVAQPCGEGEIIIAVALGRPDFEDNGAHTGLPRTFCARVALLSVSSLSRSAATSPPPGASRAPEYPPTPPAAITAIFMD